MKNFEGVLARVDCLSDGPPFNTTKKRRRILIMKHAATEALPTLVGKPINCSQDLLRHDYDAVCGYITAAYIDRENAVRVRGVVDETRIPTQNYEVLGMSLEADKAIVADMRRRSWVINKLRFTGASILFKQKAAYHNTEFHIKRGKPCPTILQSLKAELEKIPKSEALAAGKK